MILLPPPDAKCDTCGKPRPADAPMCGPDMWHGHQWCCRHAVTMTCPECYPSDAMRCPVCGREDEYT